MAIFKNRVEIRNKGRLYGGLTIEPVTLALGERSSYETPKEDKATKQMLPYNI